MPRHFATKRPHSRTVARNSVILEISSHHLLQPLHGPRYPRMHSLSQLLPYFFELGCHAFADRFPVDREFARLVVCPTNVGETQKAEGFRLPYSTPLPVLSGKAPEFNQARFLRMQLQPEFRQPFPQLLQELLRVLPVLDPSTGMRVHGLPTMPRGIDCRSLSKN